MQAKYAQDKYFFPLSAIVFLLIGVLGFWSSFVSGLPEVAHFDGWVLFHGFISFSWLIVYLVQSVLPSRGLLALHKGLGYFSVLLFLLLYVSSIQVSVSAFLQDYPPPLRQLISNLFFLQLVAFLLNPLFFWLAYKNRIACPGDHKRYMFLLAFFLIEAAASRIRWLPGMQSEEYWLLIQYLYLDTILVVLVLYDLKTIKRLASATKNGLVILLVYQAIAVLAWNSNIWINISNQLLEIGK